MRLSSRLAATAGVLLAAGAVTVGARPGPNHHPTSPAPTPPAVTGTPTAHPSLGFTSQTAVSVTAPVGGVFGVGSVWRHQVGADAVDPASAAMVNGLSDQVTSRYGGIAAFNVWDYNTSFYTVAPTTPRTTVIWDDCQHKGYTPAGLTGAGGQFSDVPIPSDAVPAGGSDEELTISDPGTDQLWEFWQTQHKADGWHACWGGRLDHVSTSQGYFANGFGASASGLAVAGGMISIADATSGTINHAVGLAIPNPAIYTRFTWPAQRSDGNDSSPTAIPEGTRLRLDPTLDLTSLHLNPLAQMIAKAAQTYGFIVTDSSGAVAVNTESGTPTQTRTGHNPWETLLGGTPSYDVMAGFPWSSLQALDEPRPAAATTG